MEIRLLSVLHFVTLFFTLQGKSLEKQIVKNESDRQRLKSSQINVKHIIQKRDERIAVLSETLNDLKDSASVTNDETVQYLQSSIGDGSTLMENIPAGETLDDVKRLGDDYSVKLENLQDDFSRNFNNIGDEATKNIEKLGEQVNQQVEKYGKEAMENFNKFQKEAGETFKEVSKNFEGTANDLSNFANKKGQETIDDAQQWFKDK